MREYDQPVPVIYYHSVGEKNPGWKRNFLTLETKYFEDQIRYFRENFSVISLKEMLDIREGSAKPVSNPLVITFDDGYLDNWIWAFPVLKRYDTKATIFVSPEFVDQQPVVRPTSLDIKEGRADYDQAGNVGFLSWEEMRLMEQSGLIDIQSHTMSHTKLFVSDHLTGFHPGADSFYATCNLFRDYKPYCISDPGFGELLEPGYPIFEEKSALIARAVTINKDFNDESIALLKSYPFGKYEFSSAWARIKPVYEYFKSQNRLIMAIETEQDYLKRLHYEIYESKAVIEKALNKRVDIIAWPHGDTSETAVELAFAAGYRGITSGKILSGRSDFRIFPERIGTGSIAKSRFLTIWRTRMKVNRYIKRFPYFQIDKLYRLIKD